MEKSKFEVFTESYKGVIKEGEFSDVEGIANGTTLSDIVRKSNLRPFDGTDDDAYPGVTSTYPMIGEYDDFIVVLDGDEIQLFKSGVDSMVYMFKVVSTGSTGWKRVVLNNS